MQIPGISDLILKNLKKSRYEKYLELLPDFKAKKNEKIITAILTLSASIILGIFAINPTLSTIATLQKQLDDNKFLESKMKEKINNLSSLQQQYESIQNDLVLVTNAVPKTSEIPSLIAMFQALANDSGIKLINTQSLPVEVSKKALANKKYSSYEFGIAAQGDYQKIIIFLDKLVNFQRIVTVENVSITKSTAINEQLLKLNVGGHAYFKE